MWFKSIALGACVALAVAWLWLNSYAGCDDVFDVCGLNINKVSYSKYVKDEQGQYLHILLANDERYRLKTNLKDVDPAYIKLLLAFEDKRFYKHSGVDWRGVLRAVYQNLSAFKVVSGASTISMQTISLLEPKPRSFANKLQEIRKAIYIEKHLTKDQILSLYLSIAPFGGNIESVQMASLYWFGKSASSLTPSEAAVLVSLPQSPENRRPDRFVKATEAARNKVLNRALMADLIGPQYIEAAKLSPINTTAFNIPKYTPHLAWYCYYKALDCSSTSLNFQLQQKVSGIAKQVILAPDTNLSILVADAATGHIKVYIGSQDYYNFSNLGANDFIQAKRSPGSTLKPFIYAMAVDEGNLTFSTLAKDQLRDFAGYQPLNISKQFLGDISIADALKASLNIPAVATLKGIGVNNFLSRLALVNINMQNAEGLSVALGGGDLSLWELVKLYSLLSNEGSVVDLSITNQKNTKIKLFEPNTVGQLNTILTQYVRGKNRVSGAIINTDIALKTGTGPNQTDAWTIGNNGNYIVGVWVGSPTGKGLIDNLGALKALPILTQIFDNLRQGQLSKAPLPKYVRSNLIEAKKRFQIVYPENNSQIEIVNDSLRLRPHVINAQYPLSVVINGSDVRNLVDETSVITFKQSGGYSLVLIDDKGVSSSVYFYVKLGQ